MAIISQSTGSPHTAAITQDLVEDDLIAIPLSWYSGWADPEFGANALETYATYCVESMNGIESELNNRDVQTVAIISFPSEYGGDGDTGARDGRRAAGLEIVYDGAGEVTQPSADNPNPDWSGVISQIVEVESRPRLDHDQPDVVGAQSWPEQSGQGFQGLWSGKVALVQLPDARHRSRPSAGSVLRHVRLRRHVG